MADPYSILGVSKGADEKAIKTAYRKLAKELHPDKNTDNPKAADRFSEVTRAYDLLSDAKKRGQYDRGEIDENGQARAAYGYGGGGFGGGGQTPNSANFDFAGSGIDLGDIFDGIFGGGGTAGARPNPGSRPQQPPLARGANIAYEHLVSFTDAATLAPQRITLRDGKTVEFKLPKGVVSGQQIRIPGKGQPGPAGHGDAMVTLKIGKHPYLSRDGDNIRIDLPISLKEAVAGGKVKVPTVDGPILLTVPPRTNSGATLRIKGRGFTDKLGERGDQLVSLMIHLPQDPAELAKLNECLSDQPVRVNMSV
jgi:DnaJ-class molecular chaperone